MNEPRLTDLQAIEAAVWRELSKAVGDRDHAWRLGVLATTDGQSADARTVVLREVDGQARRLLIYTDARSPKLQHIETHPLATLVLWSPALAWQLRVRLALEVHTEGLEVSSHWARLELTTAAQDYLSQLAPGSAIEAGNVGVAPQRENRAHFAVLAAKVLGIDWLELDTQGHRRAWFETLARRWIAP